MSISSSFGTSPSPISLLNPPNPSLAPIDSVPRGGILLNRRESDSPQIRPSALPLISSGSAQGPPSARTGPDSPDPSTPVQETGGLAIQLLTPTPSSPLVSPAESSSGHPTRIRFAPLPDPRRPRSLSTGRNVNWKPTEGPTGETTRTVEIRGVSPDMDYDDDDEGLSDGDEDDFARRKSEGDLDDDDDKRGRRWSRTMGSWGKGTKKLLGLKDEGYSEGAPLKKSVSTGGFIGSSPFRWSQETERKNTMQGLAPSSPFARNDHRRNSSMESPSGALSSSPQPVRMLNGRVYGSRRLMEAAEREKEWREKNEPAFIEWGHGKQGAGLGSNAPQSSRGGFLGDAEEGSGMEWVKKRREERQRRAEEERRKAEGERARSDSGASEGDPGGTETSPSRSDRQTPIIQVSEHLSPPTRKATIPSNGGAQPVAIPFNHASSAEMDHLSKSAPVKMEAEKEHITEAIQVPLGPRRDVGVRGVDVFGDGRRQSSGSGRSGGSRSSRSSVPSEAKDLEEQVVEDDDESEEEEEEEDEDDDDDEEEDVPMPRSTASAAGVEKVSRHKD